MTDANKPEEKSGLQKLMDQVAGVKGDTPSWPVTIFFLSVFVVILSILGIKLALAKRKAAELAKKLREQQEEAKQAKENEQMASNGVARRDAQEVVKDVESKVQALQNDISVRKVEHEEYVKELQSVTGWDDLIVIDGRTP